MLWSHDHGEYPETVAWSTRFTPDASGPWGGRDRGSDVDTRGDTMSSALLPAGIYDDRPRRRVTAAEWIDDEEFGATGEWERWGADWDEPTFRRRALSRRSRRRATTTTDRAGKGRQ